MKTYLQNHRWASWLLQGILVAGIFLGVQAWQTRKMPSTGLPAPAMTGMTLEGRAFNLEDYRGKNVMIYFFAPWCSMCDLSISNFFSLANEGGDFYNDDTRLLAVAMAYRDEAEIREFLQNREGKVPVALADESDARQWQVPGFPTVVIIDKKGKIVHRSIGYSTWIGLRWRLLWL